MDAELALEQLDEQAGIANIVAELVVDQVPVFAQQTDGVSTNAFDFRPLSHQYKNFQHRERCALEHHRMGRFDVAIVQLEP